MDILDNVTERGSVSDFSSAAEFERQARYREPVTLLSAYGRPVRASKEFLVDPAGQIIKTTSYPKIKNFVPRIVACNNGEEFIEALRTSSDTELFILGSITQLGIEFFKDNGYVRRKKQADKGQPAFFEELPRCGYAIDVENIPAADVRGLDIFADPTGAARHVAQSFLPLEFLSGFLWAQFSASAGTKGANYIRIHFWVWLQHPIAPSAFKSMVDAYQTARWPLQSQKLLDCSLYTCVQPHYIAPPRFKSQLNWNAQLADTMPARWFDLSGPLPHTPLPTDWHATHTRKTERKAKASTVRPSKRAQRLDNSWSTLVAKRESEIGDHIGGSEFRNGALLATFAKMCEIIASNQLLSDDDVLASMESYYPHLRSVALRATAIDRADGHVESRFALDELRAVSCAGLSKAREAVRDATVVEAAPVELPKPRKLPPLEIALGEVEGFINAWKDACAAEHGVEQHNAAALQNDVQTPGKPWNASKYQFRLGENVFVCAHDVGTRKSTFALTACDALAKLPDGARVVFASQNRELTLQMTTAARAKGFTAHDYHGTDADVNGVKYCDPPETMKQLIREAKQYGGGLLESVCPVCPSNPKNGGACQYHAQWSTFGDAGIKFVQHASLPQLHGRIASGVKDGHAPLVGIVLDENYQQFEKLSLSLTDSISERAKLKFAAFRSDDKGIEAKLECATIVLAEAVRDGILADPAVINAASTIIGKRMYIAKRLRDAERIVWDSLGEQHKAGAPDFTKVKFADRARWRFFDALGKLLACQSSRTGTNTIAGLSAGVGEGGEVVANVKYQRPWESFVPTLLLDATAEQELVNTTFSCWSGRDIEGTSRDGQEYSFWLEDGVYPNQIAYQHGRVDKPFQRTLLVVGSPSAKHKMKDSTRKQASAYSESVIRVNLWHMLGASSGGIYLHKAHAQGEIGKALGLPNVKIGTHGRSVGLNEPEWENGDKFIVNGVTRLDDDAFRASAESFFALTGRTLDLASKSRDQALLSFAHGECASLPCWTYGDSDLAALERQHGEAQLEQELGRARGVNRTASNPVDVMIAANANYNQELIGAVMWGELNCMNVIDVCASTSCLPTTRKGIAAQLPMLLERPDDYKAETIPFIDAVNTIEGCMFVRSLNSKVSSNFSNSLIERERLYIGELLKFDASCLGNHQNQHYSASNSKQMVNSADEALTVDATTVNEAPASTFRLYEPGKAPAFVNGHPVVGIDPTFECRMCFNAFAPKIAAGRLPDTMLPRRLYLRKVTFDRGNRNKSQHDCFMPACNARAYLAAIKFAERLGYTLLAIDGIKASELAQAVLTPDVVPDYPPVSTVTAQRAVSAYTGAPSGPIVGDVVQKTSYMGFEDYDEACDAQRRLEDGEVSPGYVDELEDRLAAYWAWHRQRAA